jgi:hypothetical protein
MRSCDIRPAVSLGVLQNYALMVMPVAANYLFVFNKAVAEIRNRRQPQAIQKSSYRPKN